MTAINQEILVELAKEALAVQDACNLTGVVHGFSRAMTRLRGALPDAGTDELNHHPVSVLWADKIAHLTGTQVFADNDLGIQRAYRWAFDLTDAAKAKAG